ncbi:MAG TPA: heme-binding protein [Pyrinomonadaceae bacterium]|jgi:uncharacterized protein GlcG (DUF336 family)
MALFEEKPTPQANGLTLEQAQRIIEAARRKAEEIGVMMNIAVVDEGGQLTAFARMDGAWRGSIDIAVNKAYTARAFDMTSEALGEISQPGEMCYGIHASNDLRVIIFGGGIPLQWGNRIVGAIGVSGGAVPQDIEVAEAGVEAFGKES